eukprot:COSAG01_NODE_51366_length_355_cov_0.976562_1_plen_43_part_10
MDVPLRKATFDEGEDLLYKKMEINMEISGALIDLYADLFRGDR